MSSFHAGRQAFQRRDWILFPLQAEKLAQCPGMERAPSGYSLGGQRKWRRGRREAKRSAVIQKVGQHFTEWAGLEHEYTVLMETWRKAC